MSSLSAAAAAAAARAGAPAVDWQQEVAGLMGSEQWGQLLADLDGTAGGSAVAALLRRAATQLRIGKVSRGGAGGGSNRLAEAVQQVAWEKLHTGDWHTVQVVWRDAYAAACVLAAAAGLPGQQQGEQQQQGEAAEAGGGQPVAAAAAASQEAAALSSALWHLDMAAIMGGPLLRGPVDSLIDALQRRWQRLHSVAPLVTADQPEQGPGDEGASERAGKRRKVEGAEADATTLGWEGKGACSAADEAAAAAAAADAAHLPPWSLGPRGSPVATAELPSLEAFWRDYMSTETPVVISGAMEDWPALRRWSDPAYLVRVAGPRTVPVEVGEHYLAEQWGQKLMTLQQFVRHHIPGSTGSTTAGSGSGGRAFSQVLPGGGEERTLEQAPVGPEGQGTAHVVQAAQQQDGQQQCCQSQGGVAPRQPQARGYLAQHPLFDQIPALAADIREPPYCCLGEGEVQSINAWFGPANTVTPLHTDPHPNLLCQAAGRKYVRLYPPSATPAMYPHEEGMHTNSGQVDVDAPDLQRFPLFGQAHFQDCVLEAGQMLFIPAGWWHYVKSTTVSFSVSYWWR